MTWPTTGLIDTGARTENPLSDVGPGGPRWARAWGSTTDWRSDGTKMLPNSPPRSAVYRTDHTYGPNLELYYQVHPATAAMGLSTGVFLATASPTLASWVGYVLHVYYGDGLWTIVALLRHDPGPPPTYVTIGQFVEAIGTTIVDGSQLGMERRANQWTCYHNGVAMTALTGLVDSIYPAVGSVGMFGDDTSGFIYQFGGGTLAASGGGGIGAAASHHATLRSHGGRR